jgi:hypothetical protein
MEDRQGFEPWVELSPYNFLAGSPDKPLWHLSVIVFSRLSYSNFYLTKICPKESNLILRFKQRRAIHHTQAAIIIVAIAATPKLC